MTRRSSFLPVKFLWLLLFTLLQPDERAVGAVATPMSTTRIDLAERSFLAVLASAVHIIKLERYRED